MSLKPKLVAMDATYMQDADDGDAAAYAARAAAYAYTAYSDDDAAVNIRKKILRYGLSLLTGKVIFERGILKEGESL